MKLHNATAHLTTETPYNANLLQPYDGWLDTADKNKTEEYFLLKQRMHSVPGL
jgi:hypothetical protein